VLALKFLTNIGPRARSLTETERLHGFGDFLELHLVDRRGDSKVRGGKIRKVICKRNELTGRMGGESQQATSHHPSSITSFASLVDGPRQEFQLQSFPNSRRIGMQRGIPQAFTTNFPFLPFPACLHRICHPKHFLSPSRSVLSAPGPSPNHYDGVDWAFPEVRCHSRA